MNQSAYRSFFLQPTGTLHRRYEALRLYFVEQQPMANVARRFGVSYGTFCNWVSQFCSSYDADQQPPFFFNPSEVDQQDRPMPATQNQTFRSPTRKRCL